MAVARRVHRLSAAVPSAVSAQAVREVLERANYSVGGLMVALGGDLDTNPGIAPVQSRTLGDDDLAVLARLFLLDVSVETAQAVRALAPLSVDELTATGWLCAGEDGVRSPVQITPFEGLLLVHDPLAMEVPHDDVVLGLSSAARTLATLTPRHRVKSALDVGTGCGIHALLAAAHADRVVATDVNPRALAYTQLSALLSRVENLEVREGSFFDPVADERFDLVVCNPPFAISPEDKLIYRDGELGRDEVSRVALTGAAGILAPGGVAQLLVNWIHQPFESWAKPLEDWLADCGCDALLLHHVTETPLEYAAKWNAFLRDDPKAHGQALDRWTGHFAQEGITSLATGAVTLRRTDRSPPLMIHHEMASGPRGAAGDHVLRLLDAAEWLAECSDEELLHTPLQIVDAHTVASERVHSGGEYGDDSVSVALEDSVGLSDTVGPAAIAVLMGLLGGRTAADAIPGMAAAVESPPTDPHELVADMTRALVSRGVLIRMGDPGA